MGKIKTIIFDIGNVLVKFRWKEYLEDCGYNEEKAGKIADATIKSNLWKEWDRGDLDDSVLIDKFCENHADIDREIRKLFNDIDQLVREFDYSAGFIQRLKQEGYMVYLLSNYSKSHFEKSSRKFDFIRYVDGKLISYEVNHVKPEAAIYEALIKKYNIEPSEAVFLDDLPENLEGAKPFGFHTIQVKSYEQILQDLGKLGVNIQA